MLTSLKNKLGFVKSSELLETLKWQSAAKLVGENDLTKTDETKKDAGSRSDLQESSETTEVTLSMNNPQHERSILLNSFLEEMI